MRIMAQDRKMAKRVFDNCFAIPKTDEDIFYELCFCICAPQTTFRNNIKAIEELRKCDYYSFDPTVTICVDILFLENALRPVRFYHNKAKWVAEAKQKFSKILYQLNLINRDVKSKFANSVKRDWLVKNVKGLGMKAASHLLRNLGATDLAIIDTHILKFLEKETKTHYYSWKYKDLEDKLRKIANKKGLTLAELDIIIWKKCSKTLWEKFIH